MKKVEKKKKKQHKIIQIRRIHFDVNVDYSGFFFSTFFIPLDLDPCLLPRIQMF